MQLKLKTFGTVVAASALGLTLPALADSPKGADGPEALAKAIVTHLKVGDVKALTALLPPDDVLKRVVTCGGDDDDDIVEEVAETRRKVDRIAKKFGKLTFERLEVEKTRDVAAGGRIEGCVANEAVGWFEGELEFSRDEDLDVDLLRVGERWYLVELDD